MCVCGGGGGGGGGTIFGGHYGAENSIKMFLFIFTIPRL